MATSSIFSTNRKLTLSMVLPNNLVKKRVVAAIEGITHKHPEQNIVIVAHGVAIGIALSHFLDDDSTQWPKYSKNNTAFSELCLNTGQLLSYNKTDHLETDQAV